MADVERLRAYYPFDPDVLEAVHAAAVGQNVHSFRELADLYDIADGPTIIPADGARKTLQVLNLRPSQDYDETHARVLHLPMAMPVDPSMTMRAVRLFEADPRDQLIVFGNPAAAGLKHGKLSFHDSRRVWNGDLTPTVDPALCYLRREGIRSTDHIGFSYGADKAAVASNRSAVFDIDVHQGVWMEPVGVATRGMVRLARDFQPAGGKHLEAAVRASESAPLDIARRESDTGFIRYAAGLLRLSNLAIERSLAYPHFEGRVSFAMQNQAQLRTTIAWGSASELAPDDTMKHLTDSLSYRFGSDRVHAMRLEGMHHAGGDDIDLHAAIVLQALRDTR